MSSMERHKRRQPASLKCGTDGESRHPEEPPFDRLPCFQTYLLGIAKAALQHVYHHCASDFRGSTLYPLDGLKAVHPDLYQRERIKYDGRESVLSFVIPSLGVTWGSTVKLSALDPIHLVDERRRLNIPFSNLLTRNVLRIPVERLAGLSAVSYNSSTHWRNSSPGDPDVPLVPPLSEFEPFVAENYEESRSVPPLHTDYLLRQLARGERALGFVFVPHVLIAGPIDISGLTPVSL